MPDSPHDMYPPGVHSLPHDRLTQIANDIGHMAKDHPLYQEGDRIIVLIQDGVGGGIGAIDYEDHATMITDVYAHFRALCKPYGINVEMITLR